MQGVLVLDAAKEGPAGRAGVRPTKRDEYGRLVLGDIITAIDGKRIKTSSDLFKCVSHEVETLTLSSSLL